MLPIPRSSVENRLSLIGIVLSLVLAVFADELKWQNLLRRFPVLQTVSLLPALRIVSIVVGGLLIAAFAVRALRAWMHRPRLRVSVVDSLHAVEWKQMGRPVVEHVFWKPTFLVSLTNRSFFDCAGIGGQSRLFLPGVRDPVARCSLSSHRDIDRGKSMYYWLLLSSVDVTNSGEILPYPKGTYRLEFSFSCNRGKNRPDKVDGRLQVKGRVSKVDWQIDPGMRDRRGYDPIASVRFQNRA